MPILAFKCQNKKCGEEFEKLIYNGRAGVYRWCGKCNKLTNLVKITKEGWYGTEEDKKFYSLGEKVCLFCAFPAAEIEKELTSKCPKCGKKSEHVLRIEVRGKEDISRHSVRFHFDYLESEGW